MQHDEVFLFSAVASCYATVAAYLDIKTRRIPNWFTLPGIFFGIVVHGLVGGWHAMLDSLIASLIAGSIFLIFHLSGGMGGGDVKLAAAVASLCGCHSVFVFLVCTSFAGGIMAVAMICWHKKVHVTCLNVGALISHHTQHGLRPHPHLHVENKEILRLPYGVAIAVGILSTLLLPGA